MKRLTFEDAKHASAQFPYRVDTTTYAIDFDNGCRKYKQVDYGLRVYEGGLVTLGVNTYRLPDLRYRMREYHGIHFKRVADTGGIKFTDPEGTPVQKSSMAPSAILLMDYDHKVAVGLMNWVRSKGELPGAYYPHWSAIPVGRSLVTTHRRNKEREQQWLAENDEFLKLCVTTHAMLATDKQMWRMAGVSASVVAGKFMAADDNNHTLRMRYSVGADFKDGTLFKKLREHCRDKVEVPYFKFKE